MSANDRLSFLSEKIEAVITKEAKTVLVTPCYEDPTFKFLSQNGEMLLNSDDGPATTLWEFLIYFKDKDFPIFMNGEIL